MFLLNRFPVRLARIYRAALTGPSERAQKQEQWRGAMIRLRELRLADAGFGVYAGDLVAQARAERQRQIELAGPSYR
jgi:hypothetical protein